MELLYQGAEAKIYLDKGKVIKERIKKDYREEELDIFLRKTRTKKEAKLLSDVKRLGLKVPIVYNVEKFSIDMEFIDGIILKNKLNNLNFKKICRELGSYVSILHSKDVIHGDLTTSNIVLKDNEIYFIDFGLGVETKSLEKKAADLLTLFQNFKSIHQDFDCWVWFIKGYKNKDTEKILQTFDKMLKRRRYLKN